MESTPGTEVRPCRWRRWLLTTLTVLAGIIIVLLVVHTALNIVAGTKLNRTLERLRAEGLPTRVEEIAPAPVPPERNGAVPLRAAFGLLDDDPTHKTGTAALAAAVEHWYTSLSPDKLKAVPDPAAVAAMREEVAAPEMVLIYGKLYQAAECTTANFDLDYTKGPALLLPHLSKMRSLARLLAARAWLRADQGDCAGTLADIRVTIRLGRLLEQEPILISQLVRMAIETIPEGPLHRLLDQPRPDALPGDAVATLIRESETARATNRATMLRCADGERVVFGGVIFDEWLGYRPPKVTRGVSPGEIGDLLTNRGMKVYVSYPFRPLLKTDYREYLDIMADWRRDLEKPYWVPRQESGIASRLQRVPRWCVLTRMLVPALHQVHRRAAEAEAHMLLMEVALALDQYRHEKGQYPADLKELGLPQAPVDPFTGKSLLYRRNETGGAVVYSVGQNGNDDGGKVGPKQNAPLDIIWELKP